MSELPTVDIRAQIDAVYRAEAGRILATLIRLLGNFDVAEDAMHDAFNAALQRWPEEGIPTNPRSWLISTARFKAIDGFRRRTRLDASQDDVAATLHGTEISPATAADELSDDRLMLIFTCCHPSLAPEGRAALTLREVCGLTTEEIARAFLTSAPTIAQRIVRARQRSGTNASLSKSRPMRNCRGAWAPSSPLSICCSTKVTPPLRALP